MTRQLLMIAYYFPPLGGAGVQRTAKFAKYLARRDWQVKVVSVIPPFFELQDASLEAEIANQLIEVHRVNYRIRFRRWDKWPGGWRIRAILDNWLLFPDRMQEWFEPAVEVAARICQENPGIPIFSTSAPYTAHLIAGELKRQYGPLWIADFRDEWSQNPYLTVPTSYHLQRHQACEKQVLNQADAVIAVTENITAGLAKIAPTAKADFYTIPNGFDPEDFNQLAPNNNKRWTLIHAGTLNRARKKLLMPVITTLNNLIQRGIIAASEVKLQLIGAGDGHTSEFSLWDWIEIHGYLPHGEAINAINNCHLAILVESNPAAYTGKIFEYLGLKRPILGLVHPASPAAQLIKESEGGWVLGFNNEALLAEILTQSYFDWRNGAKGVNPKPEIVNRYNREYQAVELEQIITRHLKHDRN